MSRGSTPTPPPNSSSGPRPSGPRPDGTGCGPRRPRRSTGRTGRRGADAGGDGLPDAGGDGLPDAGGDGLPDAGGDDLPDAVVGTDDEFIDSLGVAAAGRARRGPAVDAAPADAASAARAASSGAADDLLTRARRGVGVDDAGGPALPARRRARRAGRDDDERAGASAAHLNKLILLTVLTIPLAIFGFVRVTQGHQSDAREWREAFDRLDDVMNEFVEVAHGPEADWARWRDRYRDAEPEIVYLVERAKNGTAGDHIERAVGQINAAVALRERGIAGEALAVPVEEAVKHARTAGGQLGIGKFEWAH